MTFARRTRWLSLLVVALLLWSACVTPTTAWEWSDFVGGGASTTTDQPSIKTLSMTEVGAMRVRDIKRRLTRTHGYSAEELGRMLDKKDLINALSFEEHKLRQKQLDEQKRYMVQRGIFAALIAVIIVLCWPLLVHAWEVAAVNFVVYTDRKRHEARRCRELETWLGFVGIVLMFVVDSLQIWLSVSILLSWVMTSPYFFPTPRLPVRPAQFMGSEVANGPLGGYGFNVGPMLVSWALRFTNGQIEAWTGRVLSASQRKQKKKARENESQQEMEERKARRAARKAAKQAAKESQTVGPPPANMLAGQQSQPSGAAASMEQPAFPQQEKPPVVIDTGSVEKFLAEYQEEPLPGEDSEPEQHTSALDDLD